MRYLGFDLGQKRTGVACGDDLTRIVTPLEVIETASVDERLAEVRRVIEHEVKPHALVVGWPVNMDGSRGQAAKRAEAFAQALRDRFDLPVHLADERQTTDAANQRLSQTGLTHGQKKSRRDALAAVAILERFLDDRR